VARKGRRFFFAPLILRPLFEHPPGPTPEEIRQRALKAAILLRDCSFRAQATPYERAACRNLMRRQALSWREEEVQNDPMLSRVSKEAARSDPGSSESTPPFPAA
jgi:hypothetical protein